MPHTVNLPLTHSLKIAAINEVTSCQWDHKLLSQMKENQPSLFWLTTQHQASHYHINSCGYIGDLCTTRPAIHYHNIIIGQINTIKLNSWYHLTIPCTCSEGCREAMQLFMATWVNVSSWPLNSKGTRVSYLSALLSKMPTCSLSSQ